jgi:molecular chaperone DnaK
MASGNTSLGMFNLEGIPPAPRGVPQVEVTFDIDASGILHASAKDMGTGKEQKITITASTKLSDKDIERMVDDAKEHEEDDRRAKEAIEEKNAADSLVYMTEKTLSELGDKFPAEQKAKIEEAMKTLKDALAGDDTGEIKKAKETLQKVVGEAGASLYKQAGAAGGAGDEDASGAEGAGPGDDAGMPPHGHQQGDGQGHDHAGKGKKGNPRKDEDNVVDADYEVEDDE